MDRQQIISSNIRSAGYDPDSQVMEVEFMNGSVYRFAWVPEDVYDDLVRAWSPGKYFNQFIKGRYLSERV